MPEIVYEFFNWVQIEPNFSNAYRISEILFQISLLAWNHLKHTKYSCAHLRKSFHDRHGKASRYEPFVASISYSVSHNVICIKFDANAFGICRFVLEFPIEFWSIRDNLYAIRSIVFYAWDIDLSIEYVLCASSIWTLHQIIIIVFVE